MLTFEELDKRAPVRMRQTYGWRYSKNIYYRPTDKSRRAYILSRLNNPGDAREKWTFTDLLEINGYEIFTALTPDGIRDSYLLNALGISVKKSRSRETDGFVFSYYGKQKYGEVIGRHPIKIQNGEVVPSPPGVRTVDETKRRAFNAKLKEIRTFFRVRAKLGAFDSLNITTLKKKYYAYKGNFTQMLLEVNPEDLSTFERLLGAMFQYQWFPAGTTCVCDTKEDLLKLFNNTIERHRERCKRDLDVVTYVQAAQ